MLKFKQINNLYKSDKSSVSSKKTKINDINPKPQPQKHSSTAVGWTPELKETDCQYASEPGHRHVSAVLPKKTVVRKLSKAIERRESKAASMSVYRQSDDPRFMESQYPVVYRTQITPSINQKYIYDNRLRKSTLEYPQKKWSSIGSEKKFRELYKLSEEPADNASKKKPRVSFGENLGNSRLPSGVPGIDVCGLTIIIRDPKERSAPPINTKS